MERGVECSLPPGYVSSPNAEHRQWLVSAECSVLPLLIVQDPQAESQCVSAQGQEKANH